MRTMPWRCLAGWAWLLTASLPAGAAGTAVPDAEALRQLLVAGRTAATLQAAPSERGCGPAGCVIEVDGLVIQRERGQIRSAQGRRVLLRTPQRSARAPELPTIDWELLGGWRVLRDGKHWGSCLEFSHAGIGKSGPYQRWTSVVLVPWVAQRPGREAQRIVAYWGSCEALTVGDAPGEVVLPVVQPTAGDATRLQIAQFHCGPPGCRSTADTRTVRVDPAQPGGGLLIDGP